MIHSLLNTKENIDYVVQDKNIVIVDYQNTGVLQTGRTWSDGLHQLIELRHKIFPSTCNITTATISNVSYFKKYNQIIGFTGTAGSYPDKDFLKSNYQLSVIKIPSLKPKRFIDKGGIICKTDAEWIKVICENCINEAKFNKRVVLIINESIEVAFIIKDILIKKFYYDSSKIYLIYEGTSNELELIKSKVFDKEDVIISTNISGRGTDLKISDNVNDNFGGLHVIISFRPKNLRVELQAFGRTSRKGNTGSGIMILNVFKYFSTIGENFTFKDAIRFRDENETQNAQLRQNKLNKSLMLDSIFGIFILDLELISFNESLFSSIQNDELYYKWSLFFLRIENEENLSESELLRKYKQFKHDYFDSVVIHNRISNPFLFMRYFHKLILIENYELAKNCLDNAIIINNDFMENAYYYRVYCLLSMKKFDTEEINSCIEYLQEANNIIMNHTLPRFLAYNASITDKTHFLNEQSDMNIILNQFIDAIKIKSLIFEKLLNFLIKHRINIKITGIDHLDNILKGYNDMIINYEKSLGFTFIFYLKYKKKFKLSILFKSILVGALGLFQVVFGCINIPFGFGFSILASGLKDISEAFKIYRKGEFSWIKYFSKKIKYYAKAFSNPIQSHIIDIICNAGNIVAEVSHLLGGKKLSKIIRKIIKGVKIVFNSLNLDEIEEDMEESLLKDESNDEINNELIEPLDADYYFNKIKEFTSNTNVKLQNKIVSSVNNVVNDIVEPINYLDENFFNNKIKESSFSVYNKIRESISLGKTLDNKYNNVLTILNFKKIISNENFDETKFFDIEIFNKFQLFINDVKNKYYSLIKEIFKFFPSNEIIKGYSNFFSEYTKKIEEGMFEKLNYFLKIIESIYDDSYEYSSKFISLYNKTINKYQYESIINDFIHDDSGILSYEIYHKFNENSYENTLIDSFLSVSENIKKNGKRLYNNKKIPSFSKYTEEIINKLNKLLNNYYNELHNSDAINDLTKIIFLKKNINNNIDTFQRDHLTLNSIIDSSKIILKEGLKFYIDDLLKREEWKSHTLVECEKIIDNYFEDVSKEMNLNSGFLDTKLKFKKTKLNNELFDFYKYSEIYLDSLSKILSRHYVKNLISV